LFIPLPAGIIIAGYQEEVENLKKENKKEQNGKS